MIELDGQLKDEHITSKQPLSEDEYQSLLKRKSITDKVPESKLRASEFWRAPAGVEKSVAFTDIKKELDSFEDQFVKAVMPIQKRQAAAIVKNIYALIQKGDYEKMTEVEMPFRT